MKTLGEDDILLNSATIVLDSAEVMNKKGKLMGGLYALSRPIPNVKLLFFRPKLAFYHSANKSKKKKGLRSWLKKRFGEPPALYDTTKLYISSLKMEKYLKDNGYFGSTVSYESTFKRDSTLADVIYHIQSNGQYQIEELEFLSPQKDITTIIDAKKGGSALKTEQPYKLSSIVEERSRLTYEIRNQGYYDFNKNYIFFEVDSTLGDLKSKVRVNIAEPSDSTFHHDYIHNEIYVFPNYSLDKIIPPSENDTSMYRYFTFINSKRNIKPKPIDKNTVLKKGVHFSQKSHDFTVNRLMSLGIFKFINIKYEPFVDSLTGQHYLDTYMYLTPSIWRTLGVDFEVSQSQNSTIGNLLGLSGKFSYTNKNSFGGGERLELSLTGGLETQLQSSGGLISVIDLNPALDLTFPWFITPFKVKRPSQYYIPYSHLNVNYNFQRRLDFYDYNSVNMSFGYKWQDSPRTSHELNPIVLSLVDLSNTQPTFDSLLLTNPRLRTSFEDIVIMGLNYSYTYSNPDFRGSGNQLYYRATGDVSGNLFRLLSGWLSNGSKPYELLNVPVTQYARIDGDVRFFRNFSAGSVLATRFTGGIGVPYGNSEVLPYLKQFFIGGTNSIRAYRFRTLGPGSYSNQEEETNNQIGFFDQAGDIKLELNLEYRFDFYSFFEGAFFVDAGNIWLLDYDPNRPGGWIKESNSDNPAQGQFKLGKILDEVAIGVGFGLRADFDFFLIRFDFATPLRSPFLPKGERWRLKDIRPLSSQWRKDNLRLNLAIGYPF
ncbi:MAG: BamA/TamA family outer membrane protein [Chitinophagales bacterium]